MTSRKTNSAKEKAKNARLKREFHISLDEYKKVLGHQQGVCAICKNAPTEISLAVDHCHSTGLLRGLLCYKCNKLLGLFNGLFRDKNDPQKDFTYVLQNMVAYILNPPVTSALGIPRYTAPGRIGTKLRAKLLKEMKSNDKKT